MSVRESANNFTETVAGIILNIIRFIYGLVAFILRLLDFVYVRVKDGIVGKSNMKRMLRGNISVAQNDLLNYTIEYNQDRYGDGNGSRTANIPKIKQALELSSIDSYERGFGGWTSSSSLSLLPFFSKYDYEYTDGEEIELPSLPPWAVSAYRLLNEAQKDFRYQPADALRSFYSAKRYLLRGKLDLYPELKTIEAKKMQGELQDLPASSRKSSISDLICDEDGDLKDILSEEDIIGANEILHEHNIDTFADIENLRVNILNFVFSIIIIAVGVILFFPLFSSFPSSGADSNLNAVLSNPEFNYEASVFLLATTFGAIGASVSGILTLNKEGRITQASERILGYWLAFVRIVIGAVSALLITLLLQSGSGGEMSLTILMGVAFASGFSERLLLYSVETFEGTVVGP
ncbi:hypothetical protein [Haladaptatus salinisoli]|uniref:hypothetical protein n=1 Tax=Haladaptatus salinisoli TaxID=2884876 RepID=UPI001D09C7D6|nr:hypothetical protein [Haladaptatus salinisoli]